MPLSEEELKQKQKEEEDNKSQIADELGAMNKWTSAPGTEAPGTESPTTESPGTDVPTTEAPSDEFETEAPSTEAPKIETEAPTTEAPVDEELLELRAKAAELELLKNVGKTETSAPPTQAPTTNAPVEDVNFLEGITEEDLTNPKVLNNVLNTVLKKGIEIGKNVSTEHMLRSIPPVMQNVVSQQFSLKDATDKFYRDNEDLTAHKKLMALQAQELGSKNPNWKLDQLFKESGDAVRKTLGLKEQAKKVKKDEKVKKPSFPRNTKSKKKAEEKPKMTPLQDEIAKMNDVKN